jgi:hypothetical protein
MKIGFKYFIFKFKRKYSFENRFNKLSFFMEVEKTACRNLANV